MVLEVQDYKKKIIWLEGANDCGKSTALREIDDLRLPNVATYELNKKQIEGHENIENELGFYITLLNSFMRFVSYLNGVDVLFVSRSILSTIFYNGILIKGSDDDCDNLLRVGQKIFTFHKDFHHELYISTANFEEDDGEPNDIDLKTIRDWYSNPKIVSRLLKDHTINSPKVIKYVETFDDLPVFNT